MVTLDKGGRAPIAPGTAAEAAAWLARLQSEARNDDTVSAFQEWLKQSPDHEAAFERATDIWEMLPGVVAVSRAQAANDDSKHKRNWMPMAAAAAVLVAVIGAGYGWMARETVYQTAPGQQQVVTLSDGSRVSLNTDSQIAVAYAGHKRHIRLERGEVLFDVAHNPERPFTVRAGDEQVRALGTSFVVRREPEAIDVTLLKGKVEVSNKIASDLGGETFRTQAILSPGQRARIDGNARVTLDHPFIEAVTAWRQGEVIFTNATLADAAKDLNRYGRVKLVVNDARVARLRVSGNFETNNAPEFAASMAQLHGLKSRRTGDTIELRP